MVMAATATSRVSPESSRARTGQLKRRLAAVSGVAGAAVIGGVEAEAVTYTPTAGIAAAQGIPGFSFVSASNVTLGSLRPPANFGSTVWDVDNSGTTNFLVENLFPNAVLYGQDGSIHTAGTGYIRNMAVGNPVGAALTAWNTGRNFIADSNNRQPQFTTNISGQFGFRFTNASDTYYGWGSLVIDPDPDNFGSGYKITEAYYNTTPGAAINVGAVPVPEPSSMALLGLGAAGVAAWRARRKVKATAEVGTEAEA